MSTPPPPDRGFEAFVPWTGLWRSGVPDGGATVAVVGVQLRTDAGRVVDARPLGLPLVLTVDGDGALVAVDGEAP